MERKQKESDLVALTGLWQNQSKSGNPYLAGKVNPQVLAGMMDNFVKILVFTNTKKEKESDPDFIAYAAPTDKPVQEWSGEVAQDVAQAPQMQTLTAPPKPVSPKKFF